MHSQLSVAYMRPRSAGILGLHKGGEKGSWRMVVEGDLDTIIDSHSACSVL